MLEVLNVLYRGFLNDSENSIGVWVVSNILIVREKVGIFFYGGYPTFIISSA